MCSIDNIVLYYHNTTNKKLDLSKDEDFKQQILNYKTKSGEDWNILECFKLQVVGIIVLSKKLVIKPRHIALIHLEESPRGITLNEVIQFKEDRIPIFHYSEDIHRGYD